tara:strand:+ start:1087 stop:1806 length:720 start_codon:yes stop_codon:yes gene_type:complete
MVSGLSGPGHWVPIAGFVTGAEKTLVIDTGMTYMSARTIFGYAHGIRPDNEVLVAITEPHFDHIGGNCFFHEKGVDIYAHRGVNREEGLIDAAKGELNRAIENDVRREANEEEAYYLHTRVVNPNRTVKSGDVIDLGGKTVQVLETPGHTAFNLSYLVPDEKVLFCGDAIVTHYIPNLGEGGPEDWKVWLKSLDLIEEKQPDIIVPGHGDVIKGREIPRAIQRIRDMLQGAIRTGNTPD